MRADCAAEAELIERARAGDQRAFSDLVLRHQGRVRQQLARLTRGDLHRADDLAQETFLQAWRALRGFRAEATLATWLYRIAWNCFLQDERGRHPRVSTDSAAVVREVEDAAARNMQGSDAEAALVEMIDNDDHDARLVQWLTIDLARALNALPEVERVAIIHCYQLDLSHSEAALVLDLPVGTLKARVARGKARLREQLACWRGVEIT